VIRVLLEHSGYALNFPGSASSVKRCRIVKDRIRLWKEGIRDLVMELCCALHNFRVRLTPWQPMV
jgi:hypothetical protein